VRDVSQTHDAFEECFCCLGVELYRPLIRLDARELESPVVFGTPRRLDDAEIYEIDEGKRDYDDLIMGVDV